MPEDNQIASMFIPTTPMFDVGDLDNQENLKQLVIQLTQYTNNIATVLNQKDSGTYVQEQFVNGQQYFANPALNMFSSEDATPRQVIRQVFLTGPLPNAGILLVPHNIPITNIYSFTRIYGTASDTTGLNYIPLPEAFVNGNIVDLAVDAVNIIIHTNWNASNYNLVYIVLEWLPY